MDDKSEKYKDDILDFPAARRIVLLCRTPQTTFFLKSDYEKTKGPIPEIYSFADYLKELEEGGYLEYKEGKWYSTQKALEIIMKYYGDIERE
jgi:hypothetical protein